MFRFKSLIFTGLFIKHAIVEFMKLFVITADKSKSNKKFESQKNQASSYRVIKDDRPTP